MMRAPTVRGFQRTPSAGIFRRAAGFSPLRLPNLAAWYDLGPTRQASTTSDDIRIDASNRVSLLADRSGNSPVNVWANNDSTVASQSVSAANKTVTGSFAISIDARMETTRPAADRTVIDKLSGNNGFQVLVLTTGVVRLRIGNGASVTNVDSTAALTSATFTRVAIGITWTDGVGAAFTQNGAALGTSVAAAVTLTNAAVSCVIGRFQGVFYRVQIGSVYDCNPALATSKLSSTFSSGGDTWTVASANDLGARISGERDLVQLTASKQPIYTAATATTPAFITFDGTDDYMKAAAFSLSQPETVYFVGQQVSWTSLDVFYDGGATGEMQIEQITGSPQIRARTSANTLGTTSDLPLGATGVVSSIYNGASSRFRVNRLTAVTGTLDSNAANGFTLGCRGDAIRFANQRTNEIAIYAAAHDTATVDRFALYAASKWRISGV